VSSPAVQFSNVSKSYAIYAAPRDRLKELATFQTRRFHTEFWALRDVSFEIQRGETFCVVGENGSGKSTLLQICAGILAPSSGTAIARGRVAALLELGSGFNPEFSGKDNVYLNGAILGLSSKDMDRRFPEIEAFAPFGWHLPLRSTSIRKSCWWMKRSPSAMCISASDACVRSMNCDGGALRSCSSPMPLAT
jgi:ABC-type polysaccharide/polyol phosphate transport system ATPase subunit